MPSFKAMNEPGDPSELHEIYGNLDANKVLSAFGKYGKYQMRTYIIANTVHMLYAMNMLIFPFISEAPEFSCQMDPPKDTHWNFTKVDECSVLDNNNWTLPCVSIPGAFYNYERKSESLAAEFDLVCDEAGSAAHGTSLYMLGGMLVTPLIMQLSDWYGRRPAFLIPFYMSLVSNLMSVFAPNYLVFLIGRFISGMTQTSFATIAVTLSLESVSVKFRSYVPILFNCFFIIGYLMSGVLKLYIHEWRWLLFATAIPSFVLLPFYSMIPESLHWLLTKKRYEEAKKYIDTACEYNDMKIDLTACQNLYDADSNAVTRTVLDIFKKPALFMSLLINGYIFIVLSFTYWSISLFSTELSDDKMTGFFLSGLIEIPGAIIANLMIHYLGRKTVSIISLLIQTIAMFALAFATAGSTMHLVLPLITKCSTVVMWSNQPLHCSEATPTSVRNVFMGVAGFIRDFGGISAPYLKHLAAWDPRAPSVVMAVMALVAAGTVVMLPETRDKELPEDLDDVDPGPVLARCLKGNKSKEDDCLVDENTGSNDH